jgi:hypothetical protein
VFELGLEQLGHLHGRAGGAGDADPRVLVAFEDLVDAAAGDLQPGGGLTVAGQDHAVPVAERQHGRALGKVGGLRGAGQAG